ncbi:MAG: hypothetical protein OEZ54_09960 [Gemmatimonadota bacterium]|nr:hypothetical protein [Gemmatimonadota bacterium]
MGFEDLIVLILVGSGLLSSVFGGKKGKAAQERKAPQTRSRQNIDRERQPNAGGTGNPQMDEILRQLGFEAPSKPKPTEAPARELQPRKASSADLFEPLTQPKTKVKQPSHQVAARLRPEPQIVSLEPVDYSTEEVRSNKRHTAFHDQFVRPVDTSSPKKKGTRIGHLLSTSSLKQGIILREILGPPKGLE